MIKIKKDGFTLSEVLITLTIVGVLALLIVPGLIKDVNNKAMMSLLQGTVTNINDIVQTELVNTRARKLSDTDIYNNPRKFLERLDYSKSQGTGKPIFYPEKVYRNINGADVSGMGAGTYNASALLKNGVGIAILSPRSAAAKQYAGRDCVLITIDLNGAKEPNISGVDLFELELSNESDLDNGIHLGDNLEHSQDQSVNLSDCKQSGAPYACYSAAVLSGFDPNYLFED